MTYLQTTAIFTGLALGLPGLLGALVVVISHQNKLLSVQLGGFWAQILGGGLGIILHELSHLLVAVLFGHRITKVALLRIPDRQDPTDQSLGYVNHAWNPHSLYQQAGNVFIGLAPVLICPIVMLLTTKWLVPVSYATLLGDLTSGASDPLGRVVVWLLLMINIAIGGFDVSPADLTNARTGLVALAGSVVIFSGVLALFSDPTTLAAQLWTLLQPWYRTFVFAGVVNLIVYFALRCLRHALR